MAAAGDYAAMVEAKICASCKGTPRPGRRYCGRCAGLQAAWHAPRSGQLQRNLRAKRIAAGMCSYCGAYPPKPGRKGCVICLDKKAKASQRHGARPRPTAFTAEDALLLTGKAQRMVQMRIDGATVPEVAKAFGHTEGGVRCLLARIRAKLGKTTLSPSAQPRRPRALDALANATPCDVCGLRGEHECIGRAEDFARRQVDPTASAIV